MIEIYSQIIARCFASTLQVFAQPTPLSSVTSNLFCSGVFRWLTQTNLDLSRVNLLIYNLQLSAIICVQTDSVLTPPHSKTIKYSIQFSSEGVKVLQTDCEDALGQNALSSGYFFSIPPVLPVATVSLTLPRTVRELVWVCCPRTGRPSLWRWPR